MEPENDPEKYKNKYRIATTRLQTWDYGSNAAYFITICVENRAHVFGKVINGEMQLSALGQAAWDCWFAIPDHFPFVLLGQFVAMPNHVHGVIVIDKPLSVNVETQNFASLPPQPPQPNRFGPQSQNLASIVRGFKIGVTKYARQNQIPFAWQARYYDNIVRSTADYERISNYIIANPANWGKDKFYAA